MTSSIKTIKESRLTSAPAVSVVMPAYNVEKFIGEAVESLLAQDFTDWELVIVDDCSTDATLGIATGYAEKDDRIAVYSSESPSGSAYLPRMTAILKGKSDVVAPLDADDYVDPDYLTSLLRHKKDTGAAIVYPAMEYFDERGPFGEKLPNDENLFKTAFAGRDTVRLTLDGWSINCGGGVIDKYLYLNAFEEYGVIFAYSCGDERLTRCLLYNAPAVAFSKAVYHYRRNPDSITHKKSIKLFDWLRNREWLVRFTEERYGRESEEYRRAQRENFLGIYEALRLLDRYDFDVQEQNHVRALMDTCYEAIDWRRMKKEISAPYYYPLRASVKAAKAAIRLLDFVKRRK